MKYTPYFGARSNFKNCLKIYDSALSHIPFKLLYMYDVITIGSATRDMFLKSKSFEIIEKGDGKKYEGIPFGQKLRVDEVAYASGGGGTNTAVTFARQGLSVASICVVGDDSTGRDIIDELKAEKVDTSFIVTHRELSSAFSVILVHSSGERSILSFKGEGQHFIANEINFDSLKTNLLYIDSIGGNIDFLNKLFNHAKMNNIKMAWNPGALDIEHGVDNLIDTLKYCDLFFLNKEEIAKLLNEGSLTIDEMLKSLRNISKKTIFTITDGRNGSYTLYDDIVIRGEIPDSPIVDATGAGDAFASGFTAEFMRSGNIEKSVKFGTANATSVVAYYGAKKGVLRSGEFGLMDEINVSKL